MRVTIQRLMFERRIELRQNLDQRSAKHRECHGARDGPSEPAAVETHKSPSRVDSAFIRERNARRQSGRVLTVDVGCRVDGLG